MWRVVPPAWPPPALLACALLLLTARAHALVTTELAPGICPSMDIRNSPDQISKLKGCRVVEGILSIVLMERATPKFYENMSFPELREVTGYILLYRTKGVKNLGDLFPNLTVVRGMELFKDFAIVIFDNGQLEALGLRSLMAVERGGVRIERNDRLCYVNTIDWSRISTDESENIIRTNYDTRFCGLCPNAQSRMQDHRLSPMQCPADASGRLLCWDENHCQKVCGIECGTRGCLNNGTCCHTSCLGGCVGTTARDCHVCRNFSFGYGGKRVCVDSCPNGTYELFRRCVTEQECRSTPPPAQTKVADDGPTQSLATSIPAYKIHENRKCEYICPSGFTEVGDITNATCQPCSAALGCFRECNGGKIDSVAAAEQFIGCTHIKGKLEIAMRSGGGNTLNILETALGEIREINGCLQVTRSYPLISLMFFKNLKKIVGVPGEYKGQVLNILNNQNLELLWDWSIHGPIDISGGSIYIHLNPKLCYNQLLPLKNMTHDPRTNFTDIEVSEDSNGNQAFCLPGSLNLEVTQLTRWAAVLTWNTYCLDDMRKLLGYSVYYLPTETNVTLYDQRDACSEIWNVIDLTIDEKSNNETVVTVNETTNSVYKKCKNTQPKFHLLTKLTPFTRYAAYVKTYTTLQDKKGAQSPIVYFRTMPGQPSPPQSLTVEQNIVLQAQVRWFPPTTTNGTIILYHVEVQANSYNRGQILAGRLGALDTCTNPSALANLIVSRVEESDVEDKSTSIAKNGTCACKEEPKLPSITRFNVAVEEERIDSIHFENDVQNFVYRKNSGKSKPIESSRHKRSADKSLNKMLVKMTKNVNPKPGVNYSNSTDEDGYVKALYYELDGSTTSLTLKNLRHYTWYTVSVWACRQRQKNETKNEYEESWCSDRSYYTFLTLELPNADVVTNAHAQLGSSNKTNYVNVTWDPPDNPNGFVVAYNVHYTKMQEGSNADAGLSRCISTDDYEVSRGYVIHNLNPGKYSIRVTPITVRGPGNATADLVIEIPTSKQGTSYDLVWGIIGGFLVLFLILAGVIWYVKRGLLSPMEAHKLFASVNPEYVSTLYVPDEWELPRENIEFLKELGQGSFGMVYEGIAKNLEKGKAVTRCAVKTVNEHATDRERIEFLNEASVMKAFDSHHVVRLLGVVSRGQPTLVVMELMECGDLKTYLRCHRPESESSLPKKETSTNPPPTLQNIMQMAIEIADGMAYLSAKKFVHRDLAARNCMVAGDLTVKVGDFGMTRDIYETDYYRKGTKGLLPVRWMSPESLKDGVFSSCTDVWSYGVVLWEMATLAMQPYQGLANEQVVRYVVEGGVMERPEHCPDSMYELMRACWSHRPSARPTFLQLVAELAPSAAPYFRQRSFFHTPQGQEMYALQCTAPEEEAEVEEVNVGAVATGSGPNLFDMSGRLASWVRDLSSLRSRASDDAAAEPLQPLHQRHPLHKGPNGVIHATP